MLLFLMTEPKQNRAKWAQAVRRRIEEMDPISSAIPISYPFGWEPALLMMMKQVDGIHVTEI